MVTMSDAPQKSCRRDETIGGLRRPITAHLRSECGVSPMSLLSLHWQTFSRLSLP
jgi:hypothetical protein